VPKISEERKAERREQILDAARHCFAKYGYEGATVVRLEETTGLSRGAIFNYFPSKEDLFIELVVRDETRISALWVNEGLEAVIREIREVDPNWLAVYLELVRRVRTDEEFRTRLEERYQELIPANRARLEDARRTGELRADVNVKQLGQFLNLILNGLAVQLASGEDVPPTKLIVRLLNDAIGGDRRRRATTPSKPRSPRSATP
jgi:TetR/AcrR family transcriptional regulator, transcriptional repressor of aconitase